MSGISTDTSSLAASVARAVELGLPRELAAEAERAALRRAGASCEHWGTARLDAYFWGIVRRSAMRGGTRTRVIRERYLRATRLEDARSAERAYGAA